MKTSMRKRLAKLLVLCLCISMFMAMGTAAYAATVTPAADSTGSITVSPLTTGESASYYKVIDQTVSVTGGVVNVLPPVWNSAVASWVRTNYSTYIGAAGDNSVTDAYNSANAASMKAFAAAMAAAIKNGSISATAITSGEGLAMGGYLILVTGGVNIHNPMIANLQPVYNTTAEAWQLDNAVTINAKASEPTIDKEVKLAADTAWSTTDTVECSYGDTVNYQITADVPSYPATATDTTFEIGDKLTNQTLDVSTIEVYGVDAEGEESELNTGYAVSQNTTTASGTSVDFLVKLTYSAVSSYTAVRVKYSATLNTGAAVGPTGNDNTGYLDYSNNPYYKTGDASPYKEKDDDTTVFTYGINVTKVDKANENTKLSGAKFKIKLGDSELKFTQNSTTKEYALDASGTVTEVETDTNGLIKVKGLEAGTYTVTETVPPKGYNLPSNASTTITITASTDSTTGALNGAATGADTGIVAQTIVNAKGAVLPQTGSAGEVILICVSVLFAISAAVFYIVDVKRKNSGENS